MLRWQDYATLPAKDVFKVEDDDLLTANLGVLGTTGMTAFFGLNKIGKPFPGDTLVVTGAAGATGSVVGQIGKLGGCRVVGVAGGQAKCAWLVDELGFDAAIDYKAQDVRRALREAAPDGVDLYFDNVGGEILDAALARLARGARVAICGAISQYNNLDSMRGPSNYMSLLVNRARMQGFVVLDYMARYPEAQREMAAWIKEGKLVAREDVVEGFESFPEALAKLFAGENVGKLVLALA
jgi:NADPH-dependent curcumin reductase CurA